MAENKMQLPAVDFSKGGGIMTAEAQSRMAEVFGAIVSAKQFPRDEKLAVDNIKKACQRSGLAAQAVYSFPRGKKDVRDKEGNTRKVQNYVTGPSIRLAEVIAQCWGNIDFGTRELEQRDGASVMQAYCTDLQTNTRRTKNFVVQHKRTAGKTTYAVTEPRDVYELTANQGARRERSCILGIIPGDIIEEAIEACEKTIKAGVTKENLPDKIAKMIAVFEKEFDVTEDMLNSVSASGSIREIDTSGYIEMRKLHQAIKDGFVKPEEYFNIPVQSDTSASMTEEFSKPKEVKNPDKKPTAKKAEPPATEKPKTDKANDDPKSDFYLFASFETVKNVIIKRDGNDDKYYQILDKFGYKTRKAIIGSDKREEVFGALNWEAATDKSKEEKPEGQENLI